MKKPIAFSIFLAMMSLSCEKIKVPVVKTVSFQIINLDMVVLTGEVTDESGRGVSKRGFYWGTTATPTINDNFSENQNGPGVFTERVGNLILGQKYFFRSYAMDAGGTHLGEVLSMKIELKPRMGTMIDARDGRTYSTVTIQKQTWMAENLAYLPSVSRSWQGSDTLPYYYVHDYQGNETFVANASANYSTYGVLYNWTAAKSACPANWHLPSDAEWDTLSGYLASRAGGLMKESGTNHWSAPNTGATNASGFSALAGGCRRYDGGFNYFGDDAYFWSATGKDSSFAWCRYLYSTSIDVFRHDSYMSSGLSVRCLLNAK